MQLIEPEKSETVFKTVKGSFLGLTTYVNKMSELVGMTKALKVLGDTFEDMAIYEAQRLKNESDKKLFDMEDILELLRDIPPKVGMDYVVVEDLSQKIVIRISRCPLYESARISGMPGEKFCEHTAIRYIDTIVKQLNPSLQYELKKPKGSKEDYCEVKLVQRDLNETLI